MIVRRPAENTREVLDAGELSREVGLVGDTWQSRPSSRTDDGSAHPGMQVTLMNARFLDLIAGTEDRWPLAGDQLIVDFDLSEANLRSGTLLEIGDAVIEVSSQPHTGCSKFSSRFGREALRFVSTTIGRRLRLRGLNARVVAAGAIRRGDPVRKTS